MTDTVVIPPEVALPLIRHRIEMVSQEMRFTARDEIDYALIGIVEDLAAVVEQLAAVA